MAKDTGDLIQIVRNVTGRVDASDPQFTDQIMLQYINDFYMLEMGQEMRLNERQTWWEFSIDENTADPLPVDLQAPFQAPSGTQFTTIGNLCYIDGFQCWWYQSPEEFYWKWPETQTYQPNRPVGVLYYNNTLTFRNPPDKEYAVKINAYQVEVEMPDGGDIAEDYLWRYVSYGAARDIFSDYGEMDLWERYEPAFRRYRSLVYARTYQQNMNQRSLPRF
jgi:hypothetical protein